MLVITVWRKRGKGSAFADCTQSALASLHRISTIFCPRLSNTGGSKGWATYQKLLKAGWTLVPSARANEFSSKSIEVKS